MRIHFAATAVAFAIMKPMTLVAQLSDTTRSVASVSIAAPAQPSTGQWRLRARMDSGEVHVEVTSEAASVTVVSPNGTFQQSFKTATPLAEWASAAERLAAPANVPAESSRAADTAGARRFASVALETPADTAKRFDLTVLQLARVGGDSAVGYLLSGTNGAWPFELHLGPAQFTALLGALRGDPNSGALPYEFPHAGSNPKPDVMGTWLHVQVDRPAQHDGEPELRYPKALRGSGIAGKVRLAFVISDAGRAQPWSIRLIGKAHPALAALARNVLLEMRFKPAELMGQKVPQYAMQEFEFHE